MAVDTYRKAAKPLQSYLESDLFNQVVTNPTFKFFLAKALEFWKGQPNSVLYRFSMHYPSARNECSLSVSSTRFFRKKLTSPRGCIENPLHQAAFAIK